jgi:hypothetical protein
MAAIFPSRLGLEVGVRANLVNLDVCCPIPTLGVSDLFSNFNDYVKIRPDTIGGGSTNVFEKFVLSCLVKLVSPKVILEIGTFKGGTTWHLYSNSSESTLVYTFDLPDTEIPVNITDRELAKNNKRPFLPDSPSIKQVSFDTKKWDGKLDDKVQFVFIDGDHSYGGIKNDTEKAIKCVDDLACICWHDCFGKDYGYGTMRYLLELRKNNMNIFRVKGLHEISSEAIWMTPMLLEKLRIRVK